MWMNNWDAITQFNILIRKSVTLLRHTVSFRHYSGQQSDQHGDLVYILALKALVD